MTPSLGRAVRYETMLRRDPIGDGLGEGLVVIGQTITRVDEFLTPADILTESQEALIRDGGFASILDPPDDDRTVRLVKRTATDTIYTVGIVRDDTVVFTSVRGVEPSVDLSLAIALADRSAAKYELLASNPQPAANTEGGIDGRVLVRPSCPGIEREGPDCEPRPTQATVTVLTDNGDVVDPRSDRRGWSLRDFTPPGHYVVRPEVPGAFASAADQEVVIAPGRIADVSIIYDVP